MRLSLLCFLLRLRAASGQAEQPRYGVDVSWPMHHESVSINYPWLPHNQDPEHVPTPDQYKDMVVQPLGEVQTKYEQFMKSCFDYYEKRSSGLGYNCYGTEQARIAMVSRQPKSSRNYTSTGYKKIRAPDHVFQPLKEFWEKNKENRRLESWHAGNIYTNHWQSPTYVVELYDGANEGGGLDLEQQIWDATRDTIQEWTGQRLNEVSLYGIRIYTEGSMLIPHVDRNPLVSSAIINVDQDVDEPWPLEVIGHDGLARNITMVPGDMVLYESHSIIHGRQFPLKGRFMANVFVHFVPVGPIDGNSEATEEKKVEDNREEDREEEASGDDDDEVEEDDVSSADEEEYDDEDPAATEAEF